MLVVALREFKDFEADVKRQPGEAWEVNEERFESLNATKFGQLVAALKLPKEEEETEEVQQETEGTKSETEETTKAKASKKTTARKGNQ